MTLGLNAEQERAARCLERPVLVSAGAGSGKTRMLTQRFVNAVTPGAVPGWKPADVGQILTITFTEKAATEVADRVRLSLSSAGYVDESRRLGDGWISTIHGLCSRLLRRHAFDAGVDPLFRVAETIEASALSESAFEEAARALIDQGEIGQRLLEEYPFGELFKAAKAVTRELAVAGLGPDDLVLETPTTYAELVAEADALFRAGITSGDCGYRGTSGDPANHVFRCEEALIACGTIDERCESDEERLGCLLQALEEYVPLKALKGTEDAAAEFAGGRASLMSRTVSALAKPFAAAFVRLATEYSNCYHASKQALGLLDFDDLQSLAVQLLEGRPDVAAAYREQFRVVMVDEFQDTDALQLRLVEALSDGNLCTVGDDKQSIYGFRGADVDVYREHRDQMVRDGALICGLHTNYRSHEDVLKFVNSVFGSPEYFGDSLDSLVAPEESRDPQSTGAVLSGFPRIETIFVDATGSAGRKIEADELASRLRELHDAGVPLGDMAILVRRYRYAHLYAQALSGVGLAGVIVGGSRFFELPEVTVIRALARSIANREDSAALGQILVSDFVPVTDNALASLRAEPPTANDLASLWELILHPAAALDGGDREALARIVEVVTRAVERVGRMPISEVLLRAVEEAGFDLRLLSRGNVGKDAFANVLKLARLADAYEDGGGVGLPGFISYVDTKERLNDTAGPVSLADDGSDAVKIMSIHASKGLEFPVVAVPDLGFVGGSDAPLARTSTGERTLLLSLRRATEDGSKSSAGQAQWYTEFAATEKEADSQERARVLYVACTRAREVLVLSGSTNLSPKGGTRAANDLVRLARVLELGIPVDGPSDEVLEPRGFPCYRRTVMQATSDEPAPCDTVVTAARPQVELPPIPAGFGGAEESGRLPQRLSYTQLTEFEHCPRRFWIRRVLGIRSVAARESETDPLAFGSALHAVLRISGRDTGLPSEERMRAIAPYHDLDAVETRRLAGAARDYLRSEVASRVATAQSLRHESPFVLRVGGSTSLLVGSIDAYARSGDSALIVDYKSGVSGEPAELRERYRLQAECYALAALDDGCETVSVEFVRPEVITDQAEIQRITFPYSAADGKTIEARLTGLFAEIEESDFAPKPAWNQCSRCDVPAPMCAERRRRRSGEC